MGMKASKLPSVRGELGTPHEYPVVDVGTGPVLVSVLPSLSPGDAPDSNATDFIQQDCKEQKYKARSLM